MNSQLGKVVFVLAFLLLVGKPALARPIQPSADQRSQIHSLRVTILSTMLADAGIGEWGFSALVEADGHRILVDTGAHPNTVLENAPPVIFAVPGICPEFGAVYQEESGSPKMGRKSATMIESSIVFWDQPGA